MFKKAITMLLAAVVFVYMLPLSFTAGAASYPAVQADKTSSVTGQAVHFTVVTSDRVDRIQTIIDGKKGGLYTKYTQKDGVRYWKTRVVFTKTGKRRVQYSAILSSGNRIAIPEKPVVIQVSQAYMAQKPTDPVKTGQISLFSVATPSGVHSVRCYIGGKYYSKTSKYTGKSGGVKTWQIPVTFSKPGVQKVSFAAYNKKGRRVKSFPSRPLRVDAEDGEPVIRSLKSADGDVVPQVEGNPAFSFEIRNQSRVTLTVCDSEGNTVQTLLSGKKMYGSKKIVWNVLDSKKELKYPLGEYCLKLRALNTAGEKEKEIAFSLCELEAPVVTTENPFVLEYDMALMKGVVIGGGHVGIEDAGFEYGLSQDCLDKRVGLGETDEKETLRKFFSGLKGGTTYYYRAYAVNEGGLRHNGETLSFTTPAKTGWPVESSFFDTVDEEYLYLFNKTTRSYKKSKPPIGYDGSAQAALHIKTVTVPVWKIVKGEYVEKTIKLRVHRKLAKPVKAIFAEIFALEKKFPVKSASGFYYRTIKGPCACSTLSNHSYGCAIDINASYNPNVKTGDPRDPASPYTITREIADIFNKYGWDWGGDWTSTKDYMHFEYLGTPVAGAPEPPEEAPAS